MSIELKQAAQQALDAFDAFGDADDFVSLFELTRKMRALRAAIQQAGAQQPATGEPVKAAPYNPTEEMRWAMKRIDPALSSDQCRALWSAAWSASPSTRPAPSVPDDVVQHIVGWWLCNEANPQDGSPWTTAPSQRVLDHMKVVSGEKHTVMRLVAIDAAMLAAK